eukprot:TRINITY_DN1533_c0_g1_i1.p1 TRINITY_DN1533_c0_g1~~TRINITY_DN1533_c0_g1_i1.p1  ORF type:complete len:562 (-),score=113.91 TRINITY_DN1533_c0_g1_i1:164-1849(-)
MTRYRENDFSDEYNENDIDLAYPEISNEYVKRWGNKKWPYIPFIILLSFSYCKDDIEVFFLYFLFANTSYGCNFNEGFGNYLTINAIVQIIAQPIVALISDKYEKYSTTILWVALLLELIIECIMFMIPGLSYTEILILQLLRSIVHSQNTISIWKVFKQKLSMNLSPSQTLEQDDIINNIGMYGITGEVVLDVYIFTSGFILCLTGYSYGFLAGFTYFMTIGTSLAAFVTSFFIFTPGFITGTSHSSVQERFCGKVKVEMLYKKEDKVNKDQTESNDLLNQIKNSKFDIKLYINFIVSQIKLTANYFWRGIVNIFTNKITGGVLGHSLLICLVWKLMSGAEPLNLAAENVNSSVSQSLGNLCAGQFENLFYEYAMNNVFYVAGAILFILVLVRTKPYYFYLILYPIVGVFFIFTLIPLMINTPYPIQVFCSSTISVFPWYLYKYSTYLANASCDTEYIGILQGIIGYIRYISPALPGILLSTDSNGLILTIAFILLILSLVYSLGFAFLTRSDLRQLKSSHEKKQLIKQKKGDVEDVDDDDDDDDDDGLNDLNDGEYYNF